MTTHESLSPTANVHALSQSALPLAAASAPLVSARCSTGKQSDSWWRAVLSLQRRPWSPPRRRIARRLPNFLRLPTTTVRPIVAQCAPQTWSKAVRRTLRLSVKQCYVGRQRRPCRRPLTVFQQIHGLRHHGVAQCAARHCRRHIVGVLVANQRCVCWSVSLGALGPPTFAQTNAHSAVFLLAIEARSGVQGFADLGHGLHRVSVHHQIDLCVQQ